MGTLNLTTADNNLTLTVNGTLIKQLYVNSTKAYQKWKTENYTETQNIYDDQKFKSIDIEKAATYEYTKNSGSVGRHSSIIYSTKIYINKEKNYDPLINNTFTAYHFTVSYDGTVLFTSPYYTSGWLSMSTDSISIGRWNSFGPDGVGNYNSIQPKIDVTVYVYEGTGYVPYSFSSQFPVITGKVDGETYLYTESFPFDKIPYETKTVSGTRRVEDN